MKIPSAKVVVALRTLNYHIPPTLATPLPGKNHFSSKKQLRQRALRSFNDLTEYRTPPRADPPDNATIEFPDGPIQRLTHPGQQLDRSKKSADGNLRMHCFIRYRQTR
jgi:hypothetical protein